jgi:hypothetical protein
MERGSSQQKNPHKLSSYPGKGFKLHEDIWKSKRDKEAEKEKFVTSKGWLHQFQNYIYYITA